MAFLCSTVEPMSQTGHVSDFGLPKPRLVNLETNMSR